MRARASRWACRPSPMIDHPAGRVRCWFVGIESDLADGSAPGHDFWPAARPFCVEAAAAVFLAEATTRGKNVTSPRETANDIRPAVGPVKCWQARRPAPRASSCGLMFAVMSRRALSILRRHQSSGASQLRALVASADQRARESERFQGKLAGGKKGRVRGHRARGHRARTEEQTERENWPRSHFQWGPSDKLRTKAGRHKRRKVLQSGASKQTGATHTHTPGPLFLLLLFKSRPYSLASWRMSERLSEYEVTRRKDS